MYGMSKTRMCRYECGTELGDFDEQENKYRELSGTLHTRERCQSLKSPGTKPLTLEALDVRLRRVESMLAGPQK